MKVTMGTVAPLRIARGDAASESVERFIDEVFRKREAHFPGGRLQRFVARLVPANSHNKVRVLLTDALRPIEVWRARRIAHAGKGQLRLHLGAGELPREGWVNIDLAGAPVDLRLNLMRPLPFADGSAAAIFHEHLLEHLSLERGLAILREIRRVLQPGGVMRISVPDARRHAGWYIGEPRAPELGVQPTELMYLLKEFYGHGHKTMYDFPTLELLCHAAGFDRVEQRGFGESRLEPCPDHPWREWDSLYVEAVVKPD